MSKWKRERKFPSRALINWDGANEYFWGSNPSHCTCLMNATSSDLVYNKRHFDLIGLQRAVNNPHKISSHPWLINLAINFSFPVAINSDITNSSIFGGKKSAQGSSHESIFKSTFWLQNIIYTTFCCFIIARNEFHLIYGQYDPIPHFFQFKSFLINFSPVLITATCISQNILFITNVKPSLCHHIIPLSKHQRVSFSLHIREISIFHFAWNVKQTFLFSDNIKMLVKIGKWSLF